MCRSGLRPSTRWTSPKALSWSWHDVRGVFGIRQFPQFTSKRFSLRNRWKQHPNSEQAEIIKWRKDDSFRESDDQSRQKLVTGEAHYKRGTNQAGVSQGTRAPPSSTPSLPLALPMKLVESIVVTTI